MPLFERRLEAVRTLALEMKKLSLWTRDLMDSVLPGQDASDPRSILALPPRRSDHAEPRLTAEQQGADCIVEHLAEMLPLGQNDSGFVLRKENIFMKDVDIDARGSVTGVIDWDDNVWFPRCLGTLRFPPWTCFDWTVAFLEYRPGADMPDWREMQRLQRVWTDSYMRDGFDPAGEQRWLRMSEVREMVWEAFLEPEMRVMACQVLSNGVAQRDVREHVRHMLERTARAGGRQRRCLGSWMRM